MLDSDVCLFALVLSYPFALSLGPFSFRYSVRSNFVRLLDCKAEAFLAEFHLNNTQ